MSDSDSWDDYPWILVEHQPPPKPKKKKKKRDLNKVKVPLAYNIRYAKDGVKWHSWIDILRPNSPPVEWPEYPDKPLVDDFPDDFDWDQVSDLDEDPVKELKKLGIPDKDIILKKPLKKTKGYKKYLELEKELAKEEEERLFYPEAEPDCPALVDGDLLYPDEYKDELDSVHMHPATGYGGAVTDRIEDDYYPHDSHDHTRDNDRLFGPTKVSPAEKLKKDKDKIREWEFDEDSGDVSTDVNDNDRLKMWKELQELS